MGGYERARASSSKNLQRRAGLMVECKEVCVSVCLSVSVCFFGPGEYHSENGKISALLWMIFSWTLTVFLFSQDEDDKIKLVIFCQRDR